MRLRYTTLAATCASAVLLACSGDGLAPEEPSGAGRIAFQMRRGGGWDIYLINAGGTGLWRLTATNGSAWAPDWSPDGSRIAFHTGGSASDIVTVNIDGTGRQNLTPNTGTVEVDPVWSPDGSRIAFVSTLGGSVSLCTMKVDGTDWRRVTVPPSGSADRVPDWSPDAAELAFQRETFPTARVYAIRADGGGLRAVADTVSGHPAW